MSTGVVITGTGIISSIGRNIEEFTHSLWKGRSGIGHLKSASGISISIGIGAEVRDFLFEEALKDYYSLPEDIIRKANRCAHRSPKTIQTSVISALEAWCQAELHENQIPSNRLGIIVAGSNLTHDYQYRLYNKFNQTPEYLSPRYALHSLDTDQVGTLSEIFGIQGEGFTVGGASASGNVAILKGYQLIQLGVLDACMIVGALVELSPMDLQGYYNIGAMGGRYFQNEPEKACRPFDRAHEGFIYGQASGCIILESLESALKRDIPVLAEVLGGSMVLDANRSSNPSEEGEIRAMESALCQAGVEAIDVDYLNAHGTSSPLGDEIEIKAIRKVFKESLSRLWVNSTKGLTGHCLSSAGVVEAIATIVQMREGFIHPNTNLDNPIDNQCRFSRAESIKADIEFAMSNSFGFGGFNTNIVFGKGVKIRPPKRRPLI